MRSLVQVQDGPFGVGGLAQLVERLLCKQDVSGSSPLTSTGRPLIAIHFEGLCDVIWIYPLTEPSFLSFLLKIIFSG